MAMSAADTAGVSETVLQVRNQQRPCGRHGRPLLVRGRLTAPAAAATAAAAVHAAASRRHPLERQQAEATNHQNPGTRSHLEIKQ